MPEGPSEPPKYYNENPPSEEDSEAEKLEEVAEKGAKEQKKEFFIINTYNEVIDGVSEQIDELEGEDKRKALTEEEKEKLKKAIESYVYNKGIERFNKDINISVLINSIVSLPKCLSGDSITLRGIIRAYKEYVRKKNAEIRKGFLRGEIEGGEPEKLVDTENLELFNLTSGDQLKIEGITLNHCVGTQPQYITKLVRGDIEILSIRLKVENDNSSPLYTIKYNVKTGVIEELKALNDVTLTGEEEYFNEIIALISKIPETERHNGNHRKFNGISSSETTRIHTEPEHILTTNGEVNFRDYDEEIHGVVIKGGKFEINTSTNGEDIPKMLSIPNASVSFDQSMSGDDIYKILEENTDVKSDVDFSSNRSLTKIPEGLVFNGNAWFNGCTGLKEIPEGLVFNGNAYFRGCTGLEKIPKDIVFNGNASFRGCTGLKEIPEGLVFKGGAYFGNCTGLKEIPEGLVFKGDAYFGGCTGLKEIPKDIVFKGDAYFVGCTGLEKISKGLVFKGGADFGGCTGLKEIPEGLVFNGDVNFDGCTSLTTKAISMLKEMKERGNIKGKLTLPS